jgi:hypothetical protein
MMNRVLGAAFVFFISALAPSFALDPAKLKPLSAAEWAASIDRGVAFLVKSQNRGGSWGSARKTKGLNITAPAPGGHEAFRAAVTALAVQALIETGAAGKDAAAKAALEKAEEWLLENLPRTRRSSPEILYNVWGHAFGISALTRMHARAAGNTPRQERIRELILSQIQMLERFESVDGGWSYYDFRARAQKPTTHSFSFVTGTVLVALHDARQIGIPVPTNLVKRAVVSIQRQRKADNTYLYGEYLKNRPMTEINRPAGSLGRSQVCNLALHLWGDESITPEVFGEWLNRIVVKNEWLSFGRKRPVPHESWFRVAGYFYYYGHYYAGLCTDQVPMNDRRLYKGQLVAILAPLQEKDGSWWDYPLYDYHQPYGTAFALLTLARCRPPEA